MRDNLIRGLRTAAQGLVGFLSMGGLDLIWKNYLSNHNANFDPTVMLVVGIALTGTASWAHNAFEDKTGMRLLPVPKDRLAGDKVMDTGIGSR